MGPEIVVPVAGCLMIFGIVAAVVYGSVQSKREMNETLRRAIDVGQSLSPDMISAIAKPTRTVEQDFRGGVVLSFLATGFVAAALMSAFGVGGMDDGAAGGFLLAAVLIGSIGLGQLTAALVRGRKRQEP